MEYLIGLLGLPWRCEECQRRAFKAAWLTGPVRSPERVGPSIKERALNYSARVFDRGTGDSDLN